MKRAWTIIAVRDVFNSLKWYQALLGLTLLRVDDFDETLSRGRNLGLCLEEEPHINPGTKTSEFSLLDPDGYYVSISALATA